MYTEEELSKFLSTRHRICRRADEPEMRIGKMETKQGTYEVEMDFFPTVSDEKRNIPRISARLSQGWTLLFTAYEAGMPHLYWARLKEV